MKERKKLILFFVVSTVIAVLIGITSFCYWEIINPLREEPYYQEALPDDLFN